MWQPLRRLTLAGATVLLVLAAQATAAGQTTSSIYTVGSLTVPGVDTGLVLQNKRTVTVTATGSICPGTGFCATPDGYPSIDTTTSGFGGFVLPGAPAYGLVAKVGTGPWTHVGSGPTKVSGTGDLVFALNDDLFPDNVGSFVVTVTYARGSATQVSAACHPGWGYGDANHDHTGPPGHSEDACYPGHGYGDRNHDHAGPPGHASDESSATNRGKGH